MKSGIASILFGLFIIIMVAANTNEHTRFVISGTHISYGWFGGILIVFGIISIIRDAD